MELPKTVTLHQMPDGYLSSQYKLTLGNEYTVRGEMWPCVVIDTDDPGETASVHWSRFVVPNDQLNATTEAAKAAVVGRG